MACIVERESVNPRVAESLLDYGPSCVFCHRPIRRNNSWCFFASEISVAFMCHECEQCSEHFEPEVKGAPH